MTMIRVFKSVFDRDNYQDCELEDFILDKKNKNRIFKQFMSSNAACVHQVIIDEKDKKIRNELKRLLLPAAQLNVQTLGIICLDIDNCSDEEARLQIVEKLKNSTFKEYILAIKESVSGNLVVLFQIDGNYNPQKAYNWVFLQAANELGVTIDYIPDTYQLRYFAYGEVYLYEPEATLLDKTTDFRLDLLMSKGDRTHGSDIRV